MRSPLSKEPGPSFVACLAVLNYGQIILKQPMKRDEVLSILISHQDGLEQLGVMSLDLFGSVARGEAGSDSDVDFIVEFARPVGLFQFIQARLYLEDILGYSVDLGTLKALKEYQ